MGAVVIESLRHPGENLAVAVRMASARGIPEELDCESVSFEVIHTVCLDSRARRRTRKSMPWRTISETKLQEVVVRSFVVLCSCALSKSLGGRWCLLPARGSKPAQCCFCGRYLVLAVSAAGCAPLFLCVAQRKGRREENKILEKPKELLPLRSAARLCSGSS